MQQEASQTSQAEPSAAAQAPRFDGKLGELFGIFLGNLALSLITLGIYRFWGKTRTRRYVWAHTSFLNEALEYSGTGKELFVGFLKAALVVILFTVGMTALQLFAASYQPGLGQFVNWLQSVMFLGLINIGTFAARRYRLNRTRWHGIRFHQSGSAWTYGLTALRGYFFLAITLGLYTPFLNARLRRYQFDNLYFGTVPFSFDGRGRDLFKPFLIAWLLVLPTLGLSMIWFGARTLRYNAQHTRLKEMRASMPVTGWAYFKLLVGNLMIGFLSLGLLAPVVTQRTMRFWCDHLRIAGQLDFAAIRQAAVDLEKSGEGLASFLDIDAGLG
jgi:uncharacterized membrane protein YjgN (DUF898 family)